MTKITIDPVTRAKLGNLLEPLELMDEAGGLLGYFSPRSIPSRPLYGDVEVPFSSEEIEQLKKQPPGRPLADIIGELQGRE